MNGRVSAQGTRVGAGTNEPAKVDDQKKPAANRTLEALDAKEVDRDAKRG